MKTTTLPKVLLCCLLMFVVNLNQAFADSDKEKKDKSKVKVTALEYMTVDDCTYKGEVVVEVKYKTKKFKDHKFKEEVRLLVLEASNDGINYSPVSTMEIESRRGSEIITFDVGECAIDIRGVIQ